jgi:hypothetical protein
VGLGEYSTYDLKTQGRWKEMLIQQYGDANATQQNEDEDAKHVVFTKWKCNPIRCKV